MPHPDFCDSTNPGRPSSGSKHQHWLSKSSFDVFSDWTACIARINQSEPPQSPILLGENGVAKIAKIDFPKSIFQKLTSNWRSIADCYSIFIKIRTISIEFCRPLIWLKYARVFGDGNPSSQKVQYPTSKVNCCKTSFEQSEPLRGHKPISSNPSHLSKPSRPPIRKQRKKEAHNTSSLLILKLAAFLVSIPCHQ